MGVRGGEVRSRATCRRTLAISYSGVSTEDNSLLSDDEIDKVVTLCMNRDFMEYMGTCYPEVIKSVLSHVHPKYGTERERDQVFIGNTNGSSCQKSRPKPLIQPQSSTRARYGAVITADDVRQQGEKEDAEPEPDLF